MSESPAPSPVRMSAPAMFAQTSMRPNRSIAVRAMREISSGRETSACTLTPVRPRARTSATTFSASSSDFP